MFYLGLERKNKMFYESNANPRKNYSEIATQFQIGKSATVSISKDDKTQLP